MNSKCWKKCPRECKKLSYKVDLSTGKVGNRKIFENLSKLKSWNKTENEAEEYVR